MFNQLKGDGVRYIIPKRKFKNKLVFVLTSFFLLATSEGFVAMLLYRVSRLFIKSRLSLLAVITSKLSLFFTGIYISPKTEIAEGCKLNHFGTCIHATSIGCNAEITHGVTIGQIRAFEDDEGYPVIGDYVYIGAGSRVFANVGDNVKIGANSVVLKDVDSDCVVAGAPAKVVKRLSTDSGNI